MDMAEKHSGLETFHGEFGVTRECVACASHELYRKNMVSWFIWKYGVRVLWKL
jgi:hypothetical protein